MRPHVIFLSDYDMHLTEQLVQGVDVWLNTPRRPWEACGTSGMKVLVNGGINLSELDGWWAEAYTPEVGWALGDGQEHDNDPAWDAIEAEALYDLLEREVIPEFYSRDEQGIPSAWVARMRESMARLTPRFSTNRAVREYTALHYLPAAAAYRERAADNGAIGAGIMHWRHALENKWAALRFGEVKATPKVSGTYSKLRCISTSLTRRRCGSSFMPNGIDGTAPSGWRCSACGNWWAQQTATSIAPRCRQTVRRRTIRREWCRIVSAWRCPWKMPISCGSDDSMCKKTAERPRKRRRTRGLLKAGSLYKNTVCQKPP